MPEKKQENVKRRCIIPGLSRGEIEMGSVSLAYSGIRMRYDFSKEINFLSSTWMLPYFLGHQISEFSKLFHKFLKFSLTKTIQIRQL